MTLTRRKTLQAAFVLPFSVLGVRSWLTPQEAFARGAEYVTLTPQEVRTLERFGETLLPGAREAGIAHFVDQQLAAAPEDCLLMLRYLDIPPPYADVYRGGLAQLDKASQSLHGRTFADLTAAQAHDLTGTVSRENPVDWHGFPAPLFYFIVRSDAVDVVYGTPEGFAKLGVPYMPHIMPPRNW